MVSRNGDSPDWLKSCHVPDFLGMVEAHAKILHYLAKLILNTACVNMSQSGVDTVVPICSVVERYSFQHEYIIRMTMIFSRKYSHFDNNIIKIPKTRKAVLGHMYDTTGF